VSAEGRRPRIRLRATRLIRPVLIVALAGLVVVIVAYFILHVKKPAPVRVEGEDVIPEKVGVKENVQWIEYQGTQGKTRARGDKHFSVGDDFFQFEGNVEILDYGKTGVLKLRLTGDTLLYDKSRTKFKMQGHARAQSRDMTFEANDFEYDKELETLQTASGASVSAGRFSGSARNVFYSVKDEEVVLEDGVQFQVHLRLRTPDPLVIRGRKLSYSQKLRRGEASGDVVLIHGKSQGRADSVAFEQWPKDDNLRMLWLKGGAHFDIEGENRGARPSSAGGAGGAPADQGSTISQEFLFNTSGRQEIAAQDIRVQAYLNKAIVRTVEARGDCLLKFFFDSGRTTDIRAQFCAMTFNRDGTMRNLEASDGARIASLDPEGSVERAIEGAGLLLEVETNILRVRGDETEKARITSATSEVSGEEITVLIKMDDFEAMRSVQMILHPSSREPGSKGFFSASQPVFVDTQALRYSSENKRFLLWDQARVWQEKRVLAAREISVSEDSGDITCEGHVLSLFPHKPKDEPKEQRVEIAADKMTYNHEANQVIYEGNCSLKTGTAALRCGTITVNPGEGSGEVASMRATKKITIVMNEREATGDQADYDVEKDIIVVTGHPILQEKDKGMVKGDKLTFYLADGRIVVENREQGRSATVIKS
jgi:lipopolysaccharide transport protein LptA